MLDILLIVVGLLVLVIAGILIVAAMQSGDFRIQRSVAINAPPAKVYALANGMRAFNLWNPFEKMDPGMGQHSGPETGPGSKYAWKSKRLGEGSMTVLEAAPASRVNIDLEFIKPFAGNNLVEFTIVPQGGGSLFTWTMSGKSAFIPKVMSLFVSNDKMIGGTFESGLADLKALAEKA